MSHFIGTSGWSYKEWQPAFYPPGLSTDGFLDHYATILNACEINATHYRVPSRDTVTRWADAVPDDFRFAVKVHRRLTDRPSMTWVGADVAFFERFVEALAPLGDKLGPLLVQLADDQARDDDALESVLVALPADVSVVLELRHASWHDPAVAARIAAAGAALCITETSGGTLADLPAGPLAYVRLRADHYADDARADWVARIAEQSAQRPTYVIARHQGLPANDPHALAFLAPNASRT